MPQASASAPAIGTRVTIVMTARERHSLAITAIKSVLRHTHGEFRFVYLDVQSPAWLREVFAQHTAQWRLEVVRFDEHLWPQQARSHFAPKIDTEYAVFIDNDVQVEDGWLDALLRCADETGAGLVGPLYLWGDGISAPRIHMMGGKLTETLQPAGRDLDEAHWLINADPVAVADQLYRRPCDFLEYHCMLVRSELLRSPDRIVTGLIDTGIRCVHEHIDIALAAGQRGYTVYVEPAARVNYLAYADYHLDDLALFRWRWSRAEGEASIERFCQKWQVLNSDRSFAAVRKFLRKHVADVDPLRWTAAAIADHAEPMRADELAQTRSALLDQAIARGYQGEELQVIAAAYRVAQILSDGGFRPCGRPFINHLTGVASVLLRYGFRAELVACGLLHAAYSHAPPHPEGAQAAIDAVSAWLGGRDNPLERRVRAYCVRESQPPRVDRTSVGASGMLLLDAEILAIEAANEVEMHLSGEFRYSGRNDRIRGERLQAIDRVCRSIGVAGLALTLTQLAAQPPAIASTLLTGATCSYRISSDKQTIVPMVSSAVALLQAR